MGKHVRRYKIAIDGYKFAKTHTIFGFDIVGLREIWFRTNGNWKNTAIRRSLHSLEPRSPTVPG